MAPSLFAPPAPTLVLRPYQREAVDAVYRHLRQRDDNPCVVLPTAAGKTPVIATICADAVQLWHGRVLVLAHVKELLEQSVEKLQAMAPQLDVGVYSAGLKRREKHSPVVVAGIQSVYNRANELGAFDLILIDEAHLIPPDGDGMYRTFLADAKGLCAHQRVVGLTATPFRLSSGPICTPDGILNHVCYEIGVRELIRDGFLSPLKSKAGKTHADTDSVKVRAGEFVAEELEKALDQDMLVEAACREIVSLAAQRRSVLIFAAGVKHGQHVANVLERMAGCECGFLDGQTPTLYRDALIRRFRSGELKYLCNVNVLTTGFDAPGTDCVVLLRPTMSPGLYYQMCGRGFRLSPGKADCLVLDFGGNVLRHGPVDQLRVKAPGQNGSGESVPPAKECPQCQALLATGYATCPECGHAFPPPQRQTHDAEAHTGGVLSGEVTISEHPVSGVSYSVHTKRNAPPDAPRTMRVDYQIGFYQVQSEWICVEHEGFARQKAEVWWRKRSRLPVPSTADEAVALAQGGALADTLSITVRSVAGETFDRIVNYQLGPVPALDGAADDDPADDYDRSEESLAEPAIAEDDLPF